jgi:uncharacterized membrane protein YdjX (TVP38/TMEM64 family)
MPGLGDRLHRIRESARAARGALVRLALFGLALLALFVGLRLAGVDASVSTVERWGDDLGTAGLIGFVPAAVVLNCVFVLPIPIAAGGAGLLFGTAAGTVLTTVVAATSAGVQNAIGRRGAGARAEQLLGERGRKFDELLERRGFTAVLYARLTPFTPFTSLNYASGITKLGARPMAIASGIAMAPRMYAYTALGGSLDDLTSHESISAFVVLVASTALGMALIAHAGVRHRRARPEPGPA